MKWFASVLVGSLLLMGCQQGESSSEDVPFETVQVSPEELPEPEKDKTVKNYSIEEEMLEDTRGTIIVSTSATSDEEWTKIAKEVAYQYPDLSKVEVQLIEENQSQEMATVFVPLSDEAVQELGVEDQTEVVLETR
ncbi:hypothetical protein [Mangrovibacillus cuniculi]|uniref:Uncharacterized protein n=1 Tax=Mangrovibacillus cuniculi TaxID=2593652 RepID=A0A7S8HGQ1_9BACI|nr:hypothetical protein [Mangrovibacillus cuniculi]QPC48128.1 hypothetical protein G8O30_14915 [Mangrovibacillus cuniculi]